MHAIIMLMRKQKRRNTRVGTSELNDSYPSGLRILARIIARCYLKEKQAQCLQKENNSVADPIPEGINDESWRGSNDQSRSSNNEP
jgi:hypothetical protein